MCIYKRFICHNCSGVFRLGLLLSNMQIVGTGCKSVRARVMRHCTVEFCERRMRRSKGEKNEARVWKKRRKGSIQLRRVTVVFGDRRESTIFDVFLMKCNRNSFNFYDIKMRTTFYRIHILTITIGPDCAFFSACISAAPVVALSLRDSFYLRILRGRTVCGSGENPPCPLAKTWGKIALSSARYHAETNCRIVLIMVRALRAIMNRLLNRDVFLSIAFTFCIFIAQFSPLSELQKYLHGRCNIGSKNVELMRGNSLVIARKNRPDNGFSVFFPRCLMCQWLWVICQSRGLPQKIIPRNSILVSFQRIPALRKKNEAVVYTT